MNRIVRKSRHYRKEVIISCLLEMAVLIRTFNNEHFNFLVKAMYCFENILIYITTASHVCTKRLKPCINLIPQYCNY